MLDVLNPFRAVAAIQQFLGAGGTVLVAIMFVTMIMWALIIERGIYWSTGHRGVAQRAKREWAARSDRSSWYASAIRDQLLSEARQESSRFNAIIKALIAATPLLGLLGTVTGMIEVFDVMASTGSTNARLMAGGISKATIPTMAGLVASLSGVFFSNWFDSNIQKADLALSDDLKVE